MDIKRSYPMRVLKEVLKNLPDAFDCMEDFRDDPDLSEVWPHDRVYVPVAAALAYMQRLSEDAHVYGEDAEKLMFEYGAKITALSGWRQNKTIYDFDEDLANELAETDADTLKFSADSVRLPTWSIYVRPNNDPEIDGFFAHYDYDRKRFELRFLAMFKSGKPMLFYMVFPLKAPTTVSEIIEENIKRFEWIDMPANHKKSPLSVEDNHLFYDFMKQRFATWINMLLYLTASNAEVKRDGQHQFKRSKRIHDLPQEVDYLHVGMETGYQIRRLHQEAQSHNISYGHHKSPVMHIRRAHWHTFLTGAGRSIPKIKWLSPVIVNPGGKPADITTIFKVR